MVVGAEVLKDIKIMTTNSSCKFDLSSGSPDGPNHLNGQRSSHGSVSLERPGSFREGADNRFSSLLPSMPRTGSAVAQGDASNLFQSILSDLKTVVPDQKFPRTGELKRGISSILGISHEDPVPALFNTKPLPSSSVEELKRMKSNINESFVKARERAKAYGEAVSKIDKYFHPLSKKRSRAEISPNDRSNALFPGANVSKNGPQNHMNSLELGTQKMEERAKPAVPNRRVRTSMLEGRVDARSNAVARPFGIPDKDKDMLKLVNGGQAPSEEKGQSPITGVDGWEKPKMKKKRSVIKSDVSVGSVMARPVDSDRESKVVQQKLGSDARSRLNNAHGFRSGPVTGTVGHGKSDLASQQNNPSMRPSPRNEQDSSSLSNDRKDRFIGLDKESSTLRSATKLNGCEENQAGSPTPPVAKLNASVRAPRSNSGSLSRPSPNTLRVAASPDDWERSQSINKFGSFGGAINRKCSSSQTASHPVAQLSGQRPQKISRVARRSNLPPGALGHDTFAFSETEISSIGEDSSEVVRHFYSHISRNKLKNDQKLPASLLENEDSGLAESKLIDKAKRFSEIGENATQSGQKVASHILPPKKNKVAAEDDFREGIRRQGRIGRGYTPTSVMSATFEKPDNNSLIKQMRSARVGSEKIESKPGRPPTKKFSEHKGCTHPRHLGNNACLDSNGEVDDGGEELLAAASSTLNTRSACPNLFWKQIEPIFGLISAEDIAYLCQQIHLIDEGSASTYVGNDDRSLQDDLGYGSLPSTPAPGHKEDAGPLSNRTYSTACERNLHTTTQVKQDEPLLEELMGGTAPGSDVSICQVLLSSIIEEEEIENFYYGTNKAGEYSYDDSSEVCFDIDAQLSPKGFHMLLSGKNQTAERTYWQENNGVLQDKFGINNGLVESYTEVLSRLGNSLDEYFGNHSAASDSLCTEFQYSQMNISERILLELSAIGLHPEHVPDLTQSEEEDIIESIHSLEEMLHELVTRKKTLLLGLEKAATESKEDQQRRLEHIALDKLVGSAYEKYLACCGPNASGGKSANKNIRHATMAFIKRTLARCQKFEKTGTSCFNEPPFRDMFLSVPSHIVEAKSTDISVDSEAANRFSSLRHSESTLTDLSHSLASHRVQRLDIRAASQISGEPLLNRVKRREVLLDDVVGSAGTSLGASAGLGSSLVSGTKGKRSGRDREGRSQNKDTVYRNGNVKIGRPPLSNAKGERKNKAKPRQRLTQLSTSVNGLLSRTAEALDTGSKSHRMVGGDAKYKEDTVVPSSSVGKQETSNNMEAIEFNLQIPELDVTDFGSQGQDIGSWLNIDDDEALQDHDLMGGLEIPMDDLSELNMVL